MHTHCRQMAYLNTILGFNRTMTFYHNPISHISPKLNGLNIHQIVTKLSYVSVTRNLKLIIKSPVGIF